MRPKNLSASSWLPALCAAGALLAGCQTSAITQSTADRVNRSPQPQDKSGLPASGVIGSRDYRIGPLDLIEVEVFGLPDLKREARVSASGDFSLPLTGAIHAEGKTIVELQTEIASQLEHRYLENPQVSVFVKEYMSQRVTIEGAVRTPGVVSLTGRTSLLQLVAMAGGPDRDANLAGIVIYRNIEDRRRAAVFDLRKIRAGQLIDPEVLGSDVIVVDYSGFRSGLRDFLQTTPLLALFVTVL